MKGLRRVLVSLGMAGAVAAVLAARRRRELPPQQGGWRELSGPELR